MRPRKPARPCSRACRLSRRGWDGAHATPARRIYAIEMHHDFVAAARARHPAKLVVDTLFRQAFSVDERIESVCSNAARCARAAARCERVDIVCLAIGELHGFGTTVPESPILAIVADAEELRGIRRRQEFTKERGVVRKWVGVQARSGSASGSAAGPFDRFQARPHQFRNRSR